MSHFLESLCQVAQLLNFVPVARKPQENSSEMDRMMRFCGGFICALLLAVTLGALAANFLS